MHVASAVVARFANVVLHTGWLEDQSRQAPWSF